MNEKQTEAVTHQTKRSSMFTGMAPKASFLFGLLSGVAVMSLVGFILTVTVVMNGNESSSGKTNGAVAGAGVNSAVNKAAEPEANPAALRAVSDDDHTQGKKNAAVTMIVFSDFQCPYCQTLHTTLQKVLVDYKDDVQLVFRHFPLESIHPNARPAGEAAECIASLGGNDAFWEFADAAFANQSALSTDFYVKTAKEVGVNEQKFRDCFDSNTYASAIDRDAQEGQEAGVQGTPATFVNDTLISGALPYESFKTAIDAALNEK